MAKFLQIAYDQEMYMNEIRRIVLAKNYEKAEQILTNTPSVGIGSLIGIEPDYDFGIHSKLKKAQYELVGSQNISKIHDNAKFLRRVTFQMSNMSTVNLSLNLDPQYMSK